MHNLGNFCFEKYDTLVFYQMRRLSMYHLFICFITVSYISFNFF